MCLCSAVGARWGRACGRVTTCVLSGWPPPVRERGTHGGVLRNSFLQQTVGVLRRGVFSSAGAWVLSLCGNLVSAGGARQGARVLWAGAAVSPAAGGPGGTRVSCPSLGRSGRVWCWRPVVRGLVFTPGVERGREGELWRGGGAGLGVGAGGGGSYHAAFLREREVRVCRECGRGEGGFRIFLEGLDRLEGCWGERVSRT